MPAQIFVSCGQRTQRERDFATRLKAGLEQDGFAVYVAIRAQSLEDVNSGIVRQLELSDYYLFVDFRRERIARGVRRGSLFTHQELAIAHRSGFERSLFFQHRGIKLEGLLRYMGANPVLFSSGDDLVELIRSTFRQQRWTSDYSRHLAAARLHQPRAVISSSQITGLFYPVDIENRRKDAAAWDAVSRLEFICSDKEGRQPSPNRSPLKVDGQSGFRQVIWPQDHGAFDVLAVGVEPPHGLYLYTALDLPRVDPIITKPGHYDLEYAVLARNFPVLRFTVSVELTGSLHTTAVTLKGVS